MKHAWALALAQGIALGAPATAASPFEIAHDPLRCVPADRFVRIVASAAPAAARAAELQFRAAPQGGWYATPMTAAGDGWAAYVPRATSSLSRFEYRVSMTGTNGETSTSPAFPVRVSPEPSGCEASGELSLSSSIVVRVPPDAPVAPPVPAGFDPAGVVAAQQDHGHGPKKALIVLGGLGTAGALVGLAAAGSSEPGAPPPDVPNFTLTGSSPSAGASVSYSGANLRLIVMMSREPTRPLDFDWRAEWRQVSAGALCVSMADHFTGAQRPTSLLLTAPLMPTAACGSSFDASVAHVTITVSGKIVWDVTLNLPFRFTP
jgi:hypothetical protein